jgi:hypothetical protein
MAEQGLDAFGQDEVTPLRAVVGSLGAHAVALDLRNLPAERALDAALAPRLQGGIELSEGSRPWRGDRLGLPASSRPAGAKL